MKHAPLLFLGLLLALALSWSGMIVAPQFQLGGQQPTNLPPASLLYPTPLPGQAQLGRDVYRANGCFYCHTQVIRQEGTELDVVLTNPGTNEAAVVQAILELRRDLKPESARKLMASTPTAVVRVENPAAANAAHEALTGAGAGASMRVVPVGPDIQRGWGTRLTVARDYLYDQPLMLGETRLGPDLTNVGRRQPDPTWHLVHLFDPKLKVPGSTMPRYPFLFQRRPRGTTASPEALPIPGEEEIIPTREARALAAYLVSLKMDTPLFEAPAPPLPTVAAPAVTNQPAATEGITNAMPADAINQAAATDGTTEATGAPGQGSAPSSPAQKSASETAPTNAPAQETP